MFRKFLNYIARPIVGEQTTERLAYQPYNGLTAVSVSGIGGHNYLQSIASEQPATVTVGPLTPKLDPSATGVSATNLTVSPLSIDPMLNAMEAQQF